MTIRERNLALIQAAIGDAELTEAEWHTLGWLAEWPDHTVERIVSAFGKAGHRVTV